MRTVVLLLLFFTLSCRQDPEMPFRQVLADYFTAIQNNDVQGMSRQLTHFQDMVARYGDTGDAIVTFRTEVEQILQSYEEERNAGELNFDPYGIKTAHIMGLGRGFYYQTESLVRQDGTATMELSHSFSYDEMDYSVFPEGTRLFFLACPPGKVMSFITGQYQKGYRLLLGKIHTRWHFRQDTNGNWRIVSMEILPETAECFQSHRPRY